MVSSIWGDVGFIQPHLEQPTAALRLVLSTPRPLCPMRCPLPILWGARSGAVQ